MANKRVLEIFEELVELHVAKDSDYGGNEPLGNFKRCEVFGIPAWKGCLVRMSDKWSRLLSLVAKDGDHAVAGEGLEDTLKDLAVYSVITLALMDEANRRQDNKTGSLVDERAETHTQVPVRAGVSSQDDVIALWNEKEAPRVCEAGP